MHEGWNGNWLIRKTLGTLQLLYLKAYSLRQIRPILEELTVFQLLFTKILEIVGCK